MGAARHEDFRPGSAPCGVGQAGAGPRAFAFPTHPPTRTRPHGEPWASGCCGQALGGQMGRLPQHQCPGAAVKEPCKRVDPGGRAPGGGLGTCVEVPRCYQRGSRQGLLFAGTRPHQLPGLVPTPTPRAPPRPTPSWCPASLSLGGPCAGGGVPVALLVKGPHGQALGAG